MRRIRLTLVLLAIWIVLVGIQYHEYTHEREMAESVLRRQGSTVANAMLGAIRSHRRLERFTTQQLQDLLDEQLKTEGLLAIGVRSADGRMSLAAGHIDLLHDRSLEPGEHWEPDGLRLVIPFTLSPDSDDRPGAGFGRGRRWQGELPGPMSAGGQFTISLMLDRAATDQQSFHAARLRGVVSAAGGLILICVAWIWRASVRLAEAHGRAQLLESEARHLRELSQAASGLAHETRNPLGVIRGWAQRLAEAEVADDAFREQAQTLVEECDRVTSRINQFLAFARPRRPTVEPVEVLTVLRELDVLLQPDLESKSVRFDLQGVAAGATVRADREMLRQALFNLSRNAAEFSPPGGSVDISLRTSDDDAWRLEIADRGSGVASDAVASLFTPYFTTRAGGTGLGLAIVHQIALAHGWEVGYAPRSGGGAVFWLGCKP